VGIGDPLGMASTHALASGMGGMRTAGDLVARMQITRGMRLTQAKESVAWNVARACTIVKPCMTAATIPVHMNVGMGVGGVPMSAYPPADATARASRALVDILKLDGL